MALFIGLFQFLALVPGTSRSGATILGAMLIGCSRTVAAEFTFFRPSPPWREPVSSRSSVLADGGGFSGSEVGILLTGCAVAFAVSMLCIRFLMNYVKKHDFKVFGWYRIGLGALVLAYFYLLKPAL
ncbi:MAG: undecaprenyl-diphosphate phosphatase [Ruthenibacterium lactatiformans]